VQESERLAELALETLPDDDVDGRFDALFRLATAAWWPGDVRRSERFVRSAVALAEEADRADLRARALRALLWLLEVRLELDEAEEAMRTLRPAAGVLELARTRHAQGSLLRMQGHLDEAAKAFQESRSLYLDAGIATDAAWSGLVLGWIAYVRGDLAAAERDFRDAVRVFGASQDHGRLCESERALAEVLAERGSLDEAERLALAAREHVSHHDLTSTTAAVRTLGLVRAAQGRHEEAEALLREALAVVEGTECRLLEVPALVSLARYLRDRGRDCEAEELEGRLPERVPGWLNDADRQAVRTASGAAGAVR
jgi:tetratricopeptide (TPR) repeat protein